MRVLDCAETLSRFTPSFILRRSRVAAPGLSEPPAPTYEPELMTAEALKLLRAFREIKDRNIRRRVVDLVNALAGQSTGDIPEDRST